MGRYLGVIAIVMLPIKGYEGLYAITKNGRVYSYPKRVHARGMWLKPRIHGFGYIMVQLCKNSHRKNHRIHRLLAIAFKPNPKRLPCVNHRNGIKADIRLRNLEWCTHKHNSMHASINGLMRRKGKRLRSRIK